MTFSLLFWKSNVIEIYNFDDRDEVIVWMDDKLEGSKR